MAPPEQHQQRSSNDHSGSGTLYYNMKTARPQPAPPSKSFSATYSSTVSHARSQSNLRSAMANSPMASPRAPPSVGQNLVPKFSPSAGAAKHRLSTPVGQVGGLAARTPSPNYFGIQIDQSVDASESCGVPREHWSPATSSVKSFGAGIPQQIPIDANPDFEAFRRQIDANKGHAGFALGSSHFGVASPLAETASGAAAARPKPSRWHTHASDINPSASQMPLNRPLSNAVKLVKSMESSTPTPREKADLEPDTNSDSAYVSAESKRSSDASLNAPSFFNLPRHESPAQYESPFDKRSGLSKVDDRHPRLSMMNDRADPPSPDPKQHLMNRSDTVPVKLDNDGPTMISPTQLKVILDSAHSDVLLLDLRVSTQYAMARIKGAINLCIPTTLLKRPTFDLERLASTFTQGADQEVFSRWKATKYLVVYDAHSSEKRDAVSAINTIRKFTTEGYTGVCSIIRGGFKAFATTYPALIDHDQTAPTKAGRPTLTLPGAAGGNSILPLAGGVTLPNGSTSNAFFANIRQNQDLVDGVGQMDVKMPKEIELEALPKWLRDAANPLDHGKQVSDKFLNIEVEEQSRMKVAYSYINPALAAQNTKDGVKNVQLCGIEKGGKNRYKDILPFEHARVKLEGKAEGTCDYINASHVKASRSHKRYIASQGPLPATFEDFWSVVWDQDVRVLVMLTAESEGGQLKCHPYWKDSEFGPIKLRLLSEKKVSLDIDKPGAHASMDSGNTHAAPTGASHDDVFGFGAAMDHVEAGRQRANTTTGLEVHTQGSAVLQRVNYGGSSGETPYVTVRKFTLSHAAHPFAHMREITQLHYASWPDFGTPAQPSHLLALVDLANATQQPAESSGSFHTNAPRPTKAAKGKLSPKKRSRSCSNIPLAWWEYPESEQATHPMLVHCSAGCGRTGTFCAVDSVLDMLKRQRIRNIKKANNNIDRKIRGHKLQAQEPKDPNGDLAMSGLTFTGFQSAVGAQGAAPYRSNPFDDAISPNTKSPQLPAFPSLSTRMSISPSPSPPSSDDDDDPRLDTSWIDEDTVDLIAATVHDFREQRLSMVQTLRQFVLCYETVSEWVWRLQERGGPAGSVVGKPGTGAGGTAAMRARGRSGTVAGQMGNVPR